MHSVVAVAVICCLVGAVFADTITQSDLQGQWKGTYNFRDFYDNSGTLFCASSSVPQDMNFTVSGTTRTVTYSTVTSSIGGTTYTSDGATTTGQVITINTTSNTIQLSASASSTVYCLAYTYSDGVLTYSGSQVNTTCLPFSTAVTCDPTDLQSPTFYATFTKVASTSTSTTGTSSTSSASLLSASALLVVAFLF